MKKGYFVLYVLLGLFLIVKGVFKILPFELISISNDQIAYNVGYFIGKIGGIAIGAFLLKLGYDKYCEEFKKVD
ncbi:hypothetical protein [Flavobacterium sp. K5-23]|uniref:hypothetical protein n=1 Tax=Flavobacterium sp. K5-23 TaxID=2746225 RepID=UPI00200EDF39|nr:hypothetical protein [Flavobacterium sp. K5-23]UQD57627.1 hypothetical protein FLAK523_15030 [Flavobacterium sp. K5-23]